MENPDENNEETTDLVSVDDLNSAAKKRIEIAEKKVVQGIAIDKLRERYSAITIESIEDKKGYDESVKAIGALKKICTGVRKRAKELTAEANTYKKAVKNKEIEILNSVMDILNPIIDRKVKIDEEKQVKKREKETQRIAILEAAGFVLVGQFYQVGKALVSFEQLDSLSDDELNDMVGQGKAEKQRIDAGLKEQAELDRKLEEKRQELAKIEKEIQSKKTVPVTVEPVTTAPPVLDGHYVTVGENQNANNQNNGPGEVVTNNEDNNEGILPIEWDPEFLKGHQHAKGQLLDFVNTADKLTRDILRGKINNLTP